jgi:hypothetical protein
MITIAETKQFSGFHALALFWFILPTILLII